MISLLGGLGPADDGLAPAAGVEGAAGRGRGSSAMGAAGLGAGTWGDGVCWMGLRSTAAPAKSCRGGRSIPARERFSHMLLVADSGIIHE